MPMLLNVVKRFALRFSIVRRIRESMYSCPDYIVNRKTWVFRDLLWPRWKIKCVAILRNGAKFHLGNDKLDDVIIRDTYGHYRELFFPMEADYAPQGCCILDVGAHHGIYTVAAMVKYPTARIIAVEPNPNSIAILDSNIRLNNGTGNVRIVKAGIASKTGQGYLVPSADGSWGDSINNSPEASSNAIPVKLMQLAEILQGEVPYIVKCNAEGGEFHLVPQLFELGLYPQVIILLMHAWEGDCDKLQSLVASKGYSIRSVLSSEAQPRLVCLRTSANSFDETCQRHH